jgi:hypothetical protein
MRVSKSAGSYEERFLAKYLSGYIEYQKRVSHTAAIRVVRGCDGNHSKRAIAELHTQSFYASDCEIGTPLRLLVGQSQMRESA